MQPLYWLYLGIALIVLEVMTPGLVSLFFGLSALTVALIAWWLPTQVVVQWLAFSVFSVLYILLLRKALKKTFNGMKEVSENIDDGFAGRGAVVTETIRVHRPGRVEFQGSTWVAEANEELAAGTAVRIICKKNLTLSVERIS